METLWVALRSSPCAQVSPGLGPGPCFPSPSKWPSWPPVPAWCLQLLRLAGWQRVAFTLSCIMRAATFPKRAPFPCMPRAILKSPTGYQLLHGLSPVCPLPALAPRTLSPQPTVVTLLTSAARSKGVGTVPGVPHPRPSPTDRQRRKWAGISPLRPSSNSQIPTETQNLKPQSSSHGSRLMWPHRHLRNLLE